MAKIFRQTLADIDREHGILWRFDTARYTVAFWAQEEDLAPEDSFCDERDVEFARSGDPAHWFCAFVGVFKLGTPRDDYDNHSDPDEDTEMVAYDTLGGCSYNSFREFYSAHRWMYSRKQAKFVTDPKSRAWKAIKAYYAKRGGNGGTYFCDMVRQALSEARAHEIKLQHVAA